MYHIEQLADKNYFFKNVRKIEALNFSSDAYICSRIHKYRVVKS